MKNDPLYYFNEIQKMFIKYDEYDALLPEEKKDFRPATFSDIALHGSDVLKSEIEPYRQARVAKEAMFGPLA